MRRATAARRFVGVAIAALVHSAAWAACPDQAFDVFGRQGYHIRDVQVAGFLVRGGTLRDDIIAATAVKPGAPVAGQAIDAGREHLAGLFQKTASLFDSPVAVTVVTADVAACDDASKQLDVVYRVYTTKVPFIGSRFVEAREAQEADPASELAMAPTPVRFRIQPRFSYDRSQGAMGGAAISMAMGRVFDRLEADIQASRSATLIDVAATSSRERDKGWLRVYDWSVGYHHADRPTDQETLKERAFVAHLTTTSRPLGSQGAVVRWASLVEAGEQRAALPAEALPEGFVASAGYGSWKNAVGVDLRSRRHGVSAAYGLQLGMSRGSDAVDYVKHVADAAYDARFRLSNAATWSHRPLDVSSRWSAGFLNAGDLVPATERFFGGGASTPFLPGAAWTLRGSPVLRSFPPQWFNRVNNAETAIGASSYQSLTVTASIPFWVHPLVPPEVVSDPGVPAKIEGQLNSAEQVMVELNRAGDPAYASLVEHLPALESHLKAVDARVAAIEAGLPPDAQTLASACRSLIEDLRATYLDPDLDPRPFLVPMFAKPADEDDATIPNVRGVCVTQLVPKAGDDTLKAAGQQLASEIDTLHALVKAIDIPRAEALAARDMRFPRDVVHSIFHELNLWSLGPALLFDGARIDLGEPSNESAARYALGGGLRFTLASSFNLTAGYAWNLNREAGEPRGAAWFAIELTAPFGR